MIKRRIPGLMRLALPAVAMLSLGAAAPTTSAVEAAGCPRNYFCVWAAPKETGTRQSFQRYHKDLREKGMPVGAYSVRNNTNAYWWAFSKIYCHGDGLMVAPGKAYPVEGTLSVSPNADVIKCQGPGRPFDAPRQ